MLLPRALLLRDDCTRAIGHEPGAGWLLREARDDVACGRIDATSALGWRRGVACGARRGRLHAQCNRGCSSRRHAQAKQYRSALRQVPLASVPVGDRRVDQMVGVARKTPDQHRAVQLPVRSCRRCSFRSLEPELLWATCKRKSEFDVPSPLTPPSLFQGDACRWLV